MNTLITEFVVTENCNLDCSYCYMKDKTTFMTIDGVHDFIKNVGKVMNIYGCQSYHISYFGGEPLLNWKVVKEAIPLFRNDPRCESQVIITNGLLIDDDVIETCRFHGIGTSWSFDGMWQNDNRPHKTIKNVLETYRQKKEMIISLCGNGCKVMVGPSNIDTMTENLEFLVDEFDITSPDFSLVRDNIWSDDDVKRFRVQSRRLADRIIKYFDSGRNVIAGIYSLAMMDMINGQIRGKRPFGCFAGCSGVGYFPNGDWYPCARYGSEKSMIIMDRDGNINHSNINRFRDPKVHNPSTYPECKSCSLYKFCNAGCTHSQYDIDSGECHPVKSVCELYKIIYNDTLYIYDILKDNSVYKSYLNNTMSQLGV